MTRQEVFIIGAKGIPAKYGGFESFVENLTLRKQNRKIHYYVACRKDLSDNKSDYYEHNNATCYNVVTPNVGPARAILFDVKAFEQALKIIKDKNIQNPIVYVLACRIGPFTGYLKKRLKGFNGKLYVNPDGHEWLRAKWNYFVRKYWKLSERLMVKNADLLICDSRNIEKYILHDYARYNPKTTYISYGSEVRETVLKSTDNQVRDWFLKNSLKQNEYYLIVGRFVPENNYETMIEEFMKSLTKKDLVIITNVEHNSFYEHLQKVTNFEKDKRIKFVGTVYNAELLKYIRENAFAYLHGHEVGGTNPSLLEALASTKINLLLNVGFNKEVGLDGALYWGKNSGNLAHLIEKTEKLTEEEIRVLDFKSDKRIKNDFDWTKIVTKYENILSEKSIF